LIEHAGEVFAEQPADDDPVAYVALVWSSTVCAIAPARMSGHHPASRFTQGGSVWSPRPAWDYHLSVGQAW
jgi:hypothetical protein